MAIVGRHMAGSLRFLDESDRRVQSLQRVRPDLSRDSIGDLITGLNAIGTVQSTGATLTVSTELVRE